MASFDKKYRPKLFSRYVGNEEIITSIKKLLDDRKKFPSTILLQGPSGCGKTTLARLIAKSLKVDKSNIYELNVADARGIDNARSIIENLRYSPITGKGKIIVLNECHQMTVDFGNALLEVLEEPPKKVYFILCTTNPEKLLNTIKTRATIFTVKHLSMPDMKKLIKTVLRKEKATLDKRVLRELITASEGTPRTALVILNAIIGVKNKRKQKTLINNFYAGGDADVRELCQALLRAAKHKEVMSIVMRIDHDPEQVRRMVLGYMAQVLLKEDNPRAALVINNFFEPFWNAGKAGLVSSVYNTINEE